MAGAPWQTRRSPPCVDIPIAGSLLSSAMSEIAQAIANRQSEIDRLQAEIKALTDVEQILGASAPTARSTSRRSSSPTKAAAAADSKSEAKPARKRREMSAAEKKAVSERMTAYWAERRKKAAKKHRGPGRDEQCTAPGQALLPFPASPHRKTGDGRGGLTGLPPSRGRWQD